MIFRMPSTAVFILIVVISAPISNGEGNSAPAWTYADPASWCRVAPLCCTGTRQSPIDVNRYASEATSQDLPPLKFSQGYLGPIDGDLKNDGHSLKFTPDLNRQRQGLFVEGGPLPENAVFEFGQFHFHWGANGGSEHTLFGQSFPAEVHLVHWNRKYGNLTEAVAHSDGLAVLGFFLDIPYTVNFNRPSALDTTDRALEILIDEFERAPYASQQGVSVPMQVNLGAFLGETGDTGRYLTYAGSLTTPPCAESVTWLVWKKSIAISEIMHRRLVTQLRDSLGRRLTDNFRPTQPLNGRTIVFNTRP